MSQPRKAEEDGDEKVHKEVQPSLSTLAMTAMLPLVRTPGCCRSARWRYAREPVAADAAEMKVWTGTYCAALHNPPASI